MGHFLCRSSSANSHPSCKANALPPNTPPPSNQIPQNKKKGSPGEEIVRGHSSLTGQTCFSFREGVDSDLTHQCHKLVIGGFSFLTSHFSSKSYRCLPVSCFILKSLNPGSLSPITLSNIIFNTRQRNQLQSLHLIYLDKGPTCDTCSSNVQAVHTHRSYQPRDKI